MNNIIYIITTFYKILKMLFKDNYNFLMLIFTILFRPHLKEFCFPSPGSTYYVVCITARPAGNVFFNWMFANNMDVYASTWSHYLNRFFMLSSNWMHLDHEPFCFQVLLSKSRLVSYYAALCMSHILKSAITYIFSLTIY